MTTSPNGAAFLLFIPGKQTGRETLPGAVLSYADKKAAKEPVKGVPPAGIFLVQERYERTGLGEALTGEIYPTSSEVVPAFPDFEPPSPENLSRPLRGS